MKLLWHKLSSEDNGVGSAYGSAEKLDGGAQMTDEVNVTEYQSATANPTGGSQTQNTSMDK